jgi:hypothetical protein
MLPLVDFHLNVLKIHRMLFTREIEGYGLIPPASAALQRQVMRTYESLGQLADTLAVLAKGPKATTQKKTKPAKARGLTTRLPSAPTPDEPDEPLDLPNRVSPFITDGSKKSTVSIDGVLWPRYV